MDEIRIWIRMEIGIGMWMGIGIRLGMRIWTEANQSRTRFPHFAGAEIRSRASHLLRPRAGPPLPVEPRFLLAMRHSIAPASGHAAAGVAAERSRRAQPTATSRRVPRRMPIPTSSPGRRAQRGRAPMALS